MLRGPWGEDGVWAVRDQRVGLDQRRPARRAVTIQGERFTETSPQHQKYQRLSRESNSVVGKGGVEARGRSEKPGRWEMCMLDFCPHYNL